MSERAGSFGDRLAASITQHDSLVALRIAPPLGHLPTAYARAGRSRLAALSAWQHDLVAATQAFVAAYLVESIWYELLGRTGVQLRRQLRRATPSLPLIWDARRSEVGAAAGAYARRCFEDWQMDAITLNPLAGHDALAAYLPYANRGIFVLCATGNPTAPAVQSLEISDWGALDREPNQPLAVQLARQLAGLPAHIGLVASGQHAEMTAALRANAPDRWLLLDAGGSTPNLAAVGAALRTPGQKVLVDDGGAVSAGNAWSTAVDALRTQVNQSLEQQA